MVFGLFSLFSKKKKEVAPPAPDLDDVDDDDDDDDDDGPGVMDAEALALIAKWDKLIADVHQREKAILDEATAASEQHITSFAGDFQPLNLMWGAVEHKVRQMNEEISDGWDEWSDEFSELDCVKSADMDREGKKRNLGNSELDIAYTRAYRQVMARASEVMYQQAVAQGPQGDLTRMFVASGARYLADWKAQEPWEVMVRAENIINQYREERDVPMELLKQYHDAGQQYWTTVWTTEAEYAPAQQQYVAGKIERYMKDITKKLNEHPQWRAQG